MLTLKGDFLGGEQEQRLLQLVEHYLHFSVKKFAIDISGVAHMNSTGLSFLIRMYNQVREQQGKMVIMYPSKSIEKMMKVTKLDNIWYLAHSKEEAYRELMD